MKESKLARVGPVRACKGSYVGFAPFPLHSGNPLSLLPEEDTHPALTCIEQPCGHEDVSKNRRVGGRKMRA